MPIYSRTKINYRKIYEEHCGPIPKGYHIHHIDGNHENNDINNLAAMPAKEHYDAHFEQGDYGACWAMVRTGHLSITPEERSLLTTKQNMNRLDRGTHPFLNGDWQSQYAKINNNKRLEEGSHHLLGSSNNLNRLKNGNHASQKKKQCPKCGKLCDSINYGRWHGDKCRSENGN